MNRTGNGNRKIVSVVIAVALIFMVSATSYAADTGDASIGFSIGPITYEPLGLSGVSANLGLSFGEHEINTISSTQTYRSQNTAGYVVNNRSGGTGSYTVVLGLSAFDNGLEGASMTLMHDGQGAISDTPSAISPPILLGGTDSVILEAGSMTSVVILEGTTRVDDPNHMALGRWGANFVGDLNIYTNTIRAGSSKAIMTWELIVA